MSLAGVRSRGLLRLLQENIAASQTRQTGPSDRIDFRGRIRYAPAMATNIDPNAMVNIPCPSCGQKTAQTVATIQSSPRLRCPSCGTMFGINAKKVMDKIRAVEEQAELDRRRRGV